MCLSWAGSQSLDLASGTACKKRCRARSPLLASAEADIWFSRPGIRNQHPITEAEYSPLLFGQSDYSLVYGWLNSVPDI